MARISIVHKTEYAYRNPVGLTCHRMMIRPGRQPRSAPAVLMMEALRSFGLATRFVTGYLYDDTSGTARGGGSTHAWCSVYLPGAGWVEYDPTNGLVAGANLVRVGVTRMAAQAIPISGGYIGSPSDPIALNVDVTVSAAPVTAPAEADAE